MPITIHQQTASSFTMIHQRPKFGGENSLYILLPRSILGMAGIGTTHKGAAGIMPWSPETKSGWFASIPASWGCRPVAQDC